MAISPDEYLSGTNYDANTGDLWFYDITHKSLHNIDLSGTDPKFFRTNGIELSPDDTELFISSAQNNPDETVRAAQIFRFQIDNKTGIPEQRRVAIDLYETLDAMGLDPGASPGLDPDGMRFDVDGNLFISLNEFQSILKWKIHTNRRLRLSLNSKLSSFPPTWSYPAAKAKICSSSGNAAARIQPALAIVLTILLGERFVICKRKVV
jgi:sugar lactone lactonase YvrE